MWDNEARQPGRGTVVRGFDAGAVWRVARERVPLHARAGRRLRQAVRLHQRVERMGGGRASRAGPTVWLRLSAGDSRRAAEVSRVDTRPPIVVVSHDALFPRRAAAGADPGADAVGTLGYDVEVLLCGDGPLVAEFAKVGRVHDFFSPASTPEVRERIVRELLHKRGARIALCNTSVVGDACELLQESRDSRSSR